jgi:hypothetical protein
MLRRNIKIVVAATTIHADTQYTPRQSVRIIRLKMRDLPGRGSLKVQTI